MRSILFIEDDPRFVDDLLGLWSPSAAVRRATSGRQALRKMQDEKPDLILLDLSLPHEAGEAEEDEGFFLLDHIRKGMKWKIPVIVITRDTRPSTRTRALATGASAVLHKPVEVAALERVVSDLSDAAPKADAPGDR
jgi:CheY-like chemotaxis protein